MDRTLFKQLLINTSILILIISGISLFASQPVLDSKVPVSLVAAAGETLTFPVTISIPDGSYIYANPKGPGIGKSTTLEFKLPQGIRLVQINYPSGEKYTPAGFDDHVIIWKKNAVINVTLYVEPGVKPDQYRIALNVNMLQCRDVCIPFDRDYNINVTVSGKSSGMSSIVDNNPPHGGNLTLNKTPDSRVDLPPEFSQLSPVCIDKKITGIIQAILLGIIAGFILNLMPCVLPVVSLKVMALIHHKEAGDRQSQRNHGLLFSAGIITSFLLLATLAAFSGYKWGGLFQQKFFVAGMSVFVFTMALSLFGVFTINIPGFAGRAASRPGSGYSDSFIKGILATLLATPCSGPFLGGVLAWAFIQPAYVIFIIFASVGLGMALPYILVAMVPALARFVPRAGTWMNTLEVVMGFFLVFTSVYLISFLGHDSAVSTMVFMIFVSMGLWQYGKFGSIANSSRSRAVSAAILASLVTSGLFVSFFLLAPAENGVEKVKFSIEQLKENRDSGKISVISFTADWCPNCKLVEKTALNTRKVRGIFADKSVEFMVADITQKNLPAEEVMSRLGSNSIPFLVVFPPGEGFIKPVCLRDIYSADDVESAVEMVKQYIDK
ncbi:MAG TPA: protein-disulfide reductase DsbD family protein [Spirochaetota bacterium]|nr:protein-disulfide reductase DsbD family protein [Spirochaetota bacterium]